jgi:hypothetical protein
MDDPESKLDNQPRGSETKPCRICNEEIRINAHYCIHCNNWQDWRAGLGISNTALSLIVAIIAVLTAGVPIIKSALTPMNSRFSFAVQDVTQDGFSALVSNQGIRPGTLRHDATLYIEEKGTAMSGTYNASVTNNASEIVVEPGKSTLVNFKFVTPLYGNNVKLLLDSNSVFAGPDNFNSCKIYLAFTNFDSTDEVPSQVFDCKKLPPIRAH